MIGNIKDYKEPNGGVGVAVSQIEWTEYERGWGQHLDGFSYHIDEDAAKKYIKEFRAGLPDKAPDCYCAPGEPITVWVDPVFALLVQGKGIVWTDKTQQR